MALKEKLNTSTEEAVERFFTENYQFNLSDFALFLSVMKNKKAYENVLSIILDERNRQFNTEMQNDSVQDDLRRRSRFYQSMIDTPILKSGKQTRYKNLPSTIIIFITQEDIFGKDFARYTFTEQCEEIEGLHLEDGTTKIFLNMKSKNGRPELISLLQYMKNTTLENPEILIKDERILSLSEIVEEVKQSEEWEAVKMNILEIGIQKGNNDKLKEQIKKKIAKGKSIPEIADDLEEEIETIETLIKELEP